MVIWLPVTPGEVAPPFATPVAPGVPGTHGGAQYAMVAENSRPPEQCDVSPEVGAPGGMVPPLPPPVPPPPPLPPPAPPPPVAPAVPPLVPVSAPGVPAVVPWSAVAPPPDVTEPPDPVPKSPEEI